jgi:WD40 repeat protein
LGFANNDIVVLDLKDFHKLKTLTGHKHEVSAISFSPDGKILVSGSMDSTLIVWTTKTWKNIKTLKGHKEQINSVCFSDDGKFLFSAGWDSKIISWDTKSWAGIIKEAHINVISSILYTKDKLISGGYDKTIKIWKVVQ